MDGFSIPRYEPTTDAKKNAELYEKTQVQRRLERNIRQNKTEALAQQAAGNQAAFDKAALKVKQSQAQYKAYCKENNLTERGYRTQVSGYNRSVASKATASVQSSMMTRRRIADDGHEIIDQPTYNKLTKKFVKNKGIIIRGTEAEELLKLQDAKAAYIAGQNLAIIRDDATVSEVLEEMIHAEQDRKNLFGYSSGANGDVVLLKREIAAQKYMLSVADKYKIPEAEIKATKANLAYHEQCLEKLLDGYNISG